MIPKSYTGAVNPTPTRFAKASILALGEGAFWWREKIEEDELEAVTERQAGEIDAAIIKHFGRVQRFLGLD